MPGSGPHRFFFVGKQPWVFVALIVLLFANTIAGVIALPILQHFRLGFVHSRAAEWYDGRFLAIQFILLVLIGIVFVIYRKDFRYEYRGLKRK